MKKSRCDTPKDVVTTTIVEDDKKKKSLCLHHLPNVSIGAIFSWLDVVNRQVLRECSMWYHEIAKIPLAACHRLILRHSSRTAPLPTRDDYKLRHWEIQGLQADKKGLPIDYLHFYRGVWNRVGQTLQVLRFTNNDYALTLIYAGEIFPELKRLHTLSHTSIAKCNPRNMEVFALLPSLTCLHLPQYTVTIANLKSAVFPKLTDLWVDTLDLCIRKETVFPNLSILRLVTMVQENGVAAVPNVAALVQIYPHIEQWNITVGPFTIFGLIAPLSPHLTSVITHLVLRCETEFTIERNLKPLRFLTSLVHLELHRIGIPDLPVLPTVRKYVFHLDKWPKSTTTFHLLPKEEDNPVDDNSASSSSSSSSSSNTYITSLFHLLSTEDKPIDGNARSNSSSSSSTYTSLFPNLETLCCEYDQDLMLQEIVHVPRLQNLHVGQRKLERATVKELVSRNGRCKWPQLDRVSTSEFILCLTGATPQTLDVQNISETFAPNDTRFTPLVACRWNDHLRSHRPPFL